jgi:hypothetical protein
MVYQNERQEIADTAAQRAMQKFVTGFSSRCVRAERTRARRVTASRPKINERPTKRVGGA